MYIIYPGVFDVNSKELFIMICYVISGQELRHWHSMLLVNR